MSFIESLKKISNNIDWKSLLFGAAFCAVLAMIGSEPGLWFFTSLAAIGLLYIGYESKNSKYGAVLGAIGAIPLYIVALQGGLGEMSYDASTVIILLIACLIIGSVTGFVGYIIKKNRQAAIEMREKDLKKGKKNKKK